MEAVDELKRGRDSISFRTVRCFSSGAARINQTRDLLTIVFCLLSSSSSMIPNFEDKR